MKKMKYLALISATALALSLSGCGGYSADTATKAEESYDEMFTGGAESWDGAMADDMSNEDMSTNENVSTNEMSMDGDTTSKVNNYQQKLIRTYYYSFHTKTYDESLKYIYDKVAKCGGYIEDSSSDGAGIRNASFTIRIPKEKTAEFLNDSDKIGEEISHSESATDVTLDYYDVDTHVKTLKTKHERLLELMKKATKLEDIIKLEGEISNVEYEINSYESQLKVYDNKIDYVTINMDIQEVTEIVVTPTEKDTYWQRVGKGFKNSLSNVKEFFGDLLYTVIVCAPQLILLALLTVIIILIVKRIIKKHKKQKNNPPA